MVRLWRSLTQGEVLILTRTRTRTRTRSREALMSFDHERLDVYQLALDFMVRANGIVERLPRGRGHLADQLSRATSVVLNIAEGAGKFSKPEKRRYY